MQPPPKTPAQPKRVFSTSIPSVRRASTSAVPATPPPPQPQHVTSKIPHNTSTPTGIPAFRSLRSLLPFGPSKHAASLSPAPPPNVSKSPFAHFGSVRRTNNKDRKASLDAELPIISIDRMAKDELEESVFRRSISCSGLEPIGGVEETPDDDDTVVFPIREVPILRTPSPGPPISADLSTILEADTSGMSKHIPSEDDSQLPSSDLPDTTPASPEKSLGAATDTSGLDFSSINVETQVLNAMRLKGSNSPQEWIAANTAVIIEGEDPDASFNFSSLDPDLAALLSPHRNTSQAASLNAKKPSIFSMQSMPSDEQEIEYSKLSPEIPQFALAPSPNIIGDTSPLLSPLQSRFPRQQSSLPRLRPSLTPTHHQTPTVAPSSDITGRGDNKIRVAPPSPLSPLISSAYGTSSAPPSPATAIYPSKPTPSISTPYPSWSTRAQASVTSLPASQSGSSSTLSRLRAPFTPRPVLHSTSPSGVDHSDFSAAYSPSSSTTQLTLRPSLDSTSRDSGSFDRPRPSLSPGPPEYLTDHTLTGRPSLQALREPGMSNSNNRQIGSAVLDRARKRSMSVQERWAGRLGAPPMRREASEGQEETASEVGDARSASSLSGRMGSRWGPRKRTESAETRTAPMTDWLGPRTLKAFKAAGLLDPEREQQDHLDRPGPGSVSGLSAGVGPSHGRYTSMRSTSEYNPRAASRLAFSEAGGSSVSRRGSGSGTVAFGLESPTTSSGSRDTARSPSLSTAPTSVSGSVVAFNQGREREWDEIRELKEKHTSETEALLGALSDSQRTTRLLREENGEIRERLERTEAENDALRRVVAELTKEAGDLRVQVQMLKSSTNVTRLGPSTRNTPVKRSGLSRPLHFEDDDDIEWSGQASGTEYNRSEMTLDSLQPSRRSKIAPDGGHHSFELPQTGSVGFSSTPAAPKHKRRFSTTSSIFPIPPANMTMLLHDEQDAASFDGGLDPSQFSPTISAPLPLHHGDSIVYNASAGSISPTNFSMTTGSPGSLFLRPEHELHLGDMDSLDLGIKPNADTAVGDGWSD
ncbi:hypothetical protein H0H92_006294 [Tricholoma furcatifolium]|nr:hypothetical protein H0H92_006294 [Tricholoma furcatifolium]